MSLRIFSVVPPTEPCALRSTQPLKVSTRDFSWGKGGRWVWLTTYYPCSAERQENPGLNLPGTPWAISACCGRPLPLPVQMYSYFTFMLTCIVIDFLLNNQPGWNWHFHPESAWKRQSETCMKLTSADCTVENSWWWKEKMLETCRVL